MYSSASGKQSDDSVNVGQAYIRVVDDHGTESWAKFPMCRGLGQDKIMKSVNRLTPRAGELHTKHIQRLQDVRAAAKRVFQPTTLICGKKNPRSK